MNIAYIAPPTACFNGDGDGIKMQAKQWAYALIEKGHNVDFINPWNHYDWKKYDIIHVFGFGLWNYDIIHWGSRLNPNFVFSPIIDSITPMWKYKLATRFGCERLRLYSQNYMLRAIKNDIKTFYVRSEYEKGYLTQGYGISDDKIAKIPLSYRFDKSQECEKEPFCLFTGTMTQPRKNVNRLIESAKKYGFNLKLAGSTGSAESKEELMKRIGNAKNIEVLGFVSDEELINLYNKAKVFALPSINEGVGLVALEASVHNCNIVITNMGGPKEYYNGLAYLVDPYNIDNIGESIVKALQDNTMQPKLRDHIIQNYSMETCINKLISSYEALL